MWSATMYLGRCRGGAERREAPAGGIVDGASGTTECADGVMARLGKKAAKRGHLYKCPQPSLVEGSSGNVSTT
jgi:hypothetical protein